MQGLHHSKPVHGVSYPNVVPPCVYGTNPKAYSSVPVDSFNLYASKRPNIPKLQLHNSGPDLGKSSVLTRGASAKSRGSDRDILRAIDFSTSKGSVVSKNGSLTDRQGSLTDRSRVEIKRPQRILSILAAEAELRELSRRATELQRQVESNSQLAPSIELQLEKELKDTVEENSILEETNGQLRNKLDAMQALFTKQLHENEVKIDQRSRKAVEQLRRQLTEKYRTDEEETVNFLDYKLRLMLHHLSRQ